MSEAISLQALASDHYRQALEFLMEQSMDIYERVKENELSDTIYIGGFNAGYRAGLQAQQKEKPKKEVKASRCKKLSETDHLSLSPEPGGR